MPYASGETPEIGDHVIYRNGKTGKITAANLNQGHLRGEDSVRVQFDDGSIGIGNALASEFQFVSKPASSEAAHFQSHCPKCNQPKPVSADRDFLKVACQLSEDIHVISTCGHDWKLQDHERKHLHQALKGKENLISNALDWNLQGIYFNSACAYFNGLKAFFAPVPTVYL